MFKSLVALGFGVRFETPMEAIFHNGDEFLIG
jgi:hypothetical protein